MKRQFFILLLSLCTLQTYGWGIIGHRTIGEIAEAHLSKKARKKIRQLMQHESLAVASVWMDEERSNATYDHTHDWHWVTIPDGMTYETAEKNKNGDVIESIERIIKALEQGHLDRQQEVIHLRMLVHLIGDVHMPLHVGNGTDKGGNDIKVKWFWRNSNLHRVWDSGIIDEKKFSYTELATALDHPSQQQVSTWQESGVRDWAYESMSYRTEIYNLPEDNSINYKYMYDHWDTVQLRLLQAGVRLAGILNKIYS